MILQFQIVHVPICLIFFEAHMNIFFITKIEDSRAH